MADMAASVLARLKNKAAESGRTYQLCLQLFCQEEFLRRLEKSKYADNLILKGGLFIYSVTNFDSRVTMDVDFLLRKVPNTPEELKIPEHHSVLILVLAMSLYQNRKNEKSPRSLMIFLPLQ